MVSTGRMVFALYRGEYGKVDVFILFLLLFLVLVLYASLDFSWIRQI